MEIVLVMFRDGERREFPLAADETIIGRRQDCGLRIPTKDVSRQHCVLLVEGESLTVKDLGSSNGTFVNDKRIAETELDAGDCLKVGPVTFVVQIDGLPPVIKPEDVAAPVSDSAQLDDDDDDADTFDLTEDDFDLDDPITALEEIDEDEDDMP